MADIKTHLRELSVATTVCLLNSGIRFTLDDLRDSRSFLAFAEQVVTGDISGAQNLRTVETITGDLETILDNGYNLGTYIFHNPYFKIRKGDVITWRGNDTQKEDPIDITIGRYGFSLKEESFILENMGLYKLLNCYTGSTYKKRHIFSDYAPAEYEAWFKVTWKELIHTLNSSGGTWEYYNPVKDKKSRITMTASGIKFEYIRMSKLLGTSYLPMDCTLSAFKARTSAKTREEVFAKFIKENLDGNMAYRQAKRDCSMAAASALARELNDNLNYHGGLPRFLRIHKDEYYYAKTTSAGVSIFKVPSLSAFGREIVIESITPSVPDTQANILTTIKNTKTGKTLILRNECRFSHGQFNGTPEAKMYYERGGALETIYERI